MLLPKFHSLFKIEYPEFLPRLQLLPPFIRQYTTVQKQAGNQSTLTGRRC